MIRSAISPPTMTMAKGRCESDPMPCETRRRQQTQSRNQHRHHDGPKPQNSAFHRGFLDRVTASAKLIDVLDHDDADLHGHAEKRQKANSR